MLHNNVVPENLEDTPFNIPYCMYRVFFPGPIFLLKALHLLNFSDKNQKLTTMPKLM